MATLSPLCCAIDLVSPSAGRLLVNFTATRHKTPSSIDSSFIFSANTHLPQTLLRVSCVSHVSTKRVSMARNHAAVTTQLLISPQDEIKPVARRQLLIHSPRDETIKVTKPNPTRHQISETPIEPAANKLPLRLVLRMETGDGVASYARNSGMQGGMLGNIGEEFMDAIVNHLTNLPRDGSAVRVADFGCSTGANTLAWADLAATGVQKRIAKTNCLESSKAPEIQHFFTDLPLNDWNLLFRDLLVAQEAKPRRYFPAAVAGSFHDRLFPRGYLHIALSVWSIHWLSKVPDAVIDVRSPAYNKGYVWIDGGHPSTAQAYAQSARQDLFNFFTHRADELAPGGLLFLMCMCRREHSRPELQTCGEFMNANVCGQLFEEAWQQLVDEGVIQPHERDSWNAPVYHFSLEEIEDAVTRTHAYDIQHLEMRRDHHWLPPGSQKAQDYRDHPETFGLWAKNFVRAIYNPLVEAHLDPARARKLWDCLEHRTTLYTRRTQNICLSMNGANYALVILSRKTT